MSVFEKIFALLREIVAAEKTIAARCCDRPGHPVPYAQATSILINTRRIRSESRDPTDGLMAEHAGRRLDPAAMPSMQIAAAESRAEDLNEDFSFPR